MHQLIHYVWYIHAPAGMPMHDSVKFRAVHQVHWNSSLGLTNILEDLIPVTHITMQGIHEYQLLAEV